MDIQKILTAIKPSVMKWTTPPSGTYTPTLSNGTNVTASTAYECMYFRIGNLVQVSGVVGIDPTATGVCGLGISLPISTTFTAQTNCGGIIAHTNGDVGFIIGNTTLHMADASIIASDASSLTYRFTLTYRVL